MAVRKRGGRRLTFEGGGVTETGYEDKNRNEDKETAGSNTQRAVLVVIEKKVEGRQQGQDQWDQSYIGYKRVMILSIYADEDD